MPEMSRRVWQGVVVQDRLVKPETFSSTNLTQAGLEPDVPEPQSSTKMPLLAYGGMPSDDDVVVTVQRSGMPGIGGARAIARKYSDASSASIGWEVPGFITGLQCAMQAHGTARKNPHAVKLSDDTVVIVYQYTTGGQVRIECLVLDPDTETWARGGNITDLVSGLAYPRWPALCVLPGDVLLCFMMTETTGGAGVNDYVQIDSYVSKDKGTSWALHAEDVTVPRFSFGGAAGATDFDPTYSRIRAAYKDGQILMLLSMRRNYTGVDHQPTIIQLASVDMGSTFTEVTRQTGVAGTSDGGALADLIVWRDKFHIVWIGYGGTDPNFTYQATHCAIGSAYDAFTSAEATTIGADNIYVNEVVSTGAVHYTEGDLALAHFEEGLVLYLREVQSNYAGRHFTYDGSTWRAFGPDDDPDETIWFDTEDATEHPQDFCAVWQRGRVLMPCTFDADDSTAQNDVFLLILGGHSSMTMPTFPNNQVTTIQSMGQWDRHWLPTDLPENYATLTQGGLGATTSVMVTGYHRIAAAIAEDDYVSVDSVSIDPTIGVMLEVEVQMITGAASAFGGVQSGVRIALGSDSTITLSIGTDKALLQDDNTTNQIGSDMPAPTSRTVYRIALSSGACTVWYRVPSSPHEELREWTVGASSTSVNTGAGLAAEISWGHIDTASVTTRESRWYRVSWSTSQNSGPAVNVSSGQTNPTDLFTWPILPAGFPLWGGLIAAAESGPGFRGESWRIRRRYAYGIENIYPSIEPSPNIGWRSTADGTTVTLKWTYTLGGDDAHYGEIFAICLWGINWKSATIQRSIGGGGLSTWGTLNAARGPFAFERYGDVVSLTVSATAGGLHIPRNALAGGTWEDDGGLVRRIVGNTAGVYGDRDTELVFKLYLDPDSITGSEDTSGSAGYFWTPYAAFFGSISSAEEMEMGSFTIVIASTDTADGDYRIGGSVIGHFTPFGAFPEWGQSRMKEANVTITEYEDGKRSAVENGPTRSTFRTAWTNPISQLETYRLGGVSTQDANPRVGYSLGTGGRPVAAADFTPGQLWGLLEDLHGSRDVCALVRSWTQPTTSATAEQTLKQYQQVVPVRLTSPVEIQTVMGHVLDPSAAEQVAELIWEEEV